VTESTPRSARSTPRSARPAACCTTPLATRFTRATGDCDRRRGRFRALLLRLLALREDLRPPLLRLAEDFRRDDFLALDFRVLLARLRVERFRAPPLLRPEDPDRDLFLPFDLLDFLAAAIGKLRVGGFVATDSKIRAQQRRETPYKAALDIAPPPCMII
jgi:hypothetical protein